MDLPTLQRGQWTLLHAGRNASKADVHVVEVDGRRYAVKDYRARPWLMRATMGRWSLRREERAYGALEGVAGVPALAGRPHPCVLATELVDGTSLADWPAGRPLPQGFFARLKEVLARVHGHGVVQGDLHHRDVLVGADGKAWLVDFSTSLCGGPRGNPLRRRLWRLAAQLDRRAVLKLQQRYEPGTLTDDEQRERRQVPAVYRWGKKLRGWLRGGRSVTSG
jgi:RIO-like serine/threonine protein kinase